MDDAEAFSSNEADGDVGLEAGECTEDRGEIFWDANEEFVNVDGIQEDNDE